MENSKNKKMENSKNKKMENSKNEIRILKEAIDLIAGLLWLFFAISLIPLAITGLPLLFYSSESSNFPLVAGICFGIFISAITATFLNTGFSSMIKKDSKKKEK
ncbi:hypothetical protein B6U91_01460 [Candidatus Pacearchaeota archaeon ex4484_71]|nr:MAG: hypothetical protein B6U91_01460 [Candidatus Pacearchaeota archaeon ex4484_71]